MTILPALSMRCSSVVYGGPGSCDSGQPLASIFAVFRITNRSIEHWLSQQMAIIELQKDGATHDTGGYNTFAAA